MHHHGWELYRLGWILYDAAGVARGNWWAVIPMALGCYWFYLRRRRRNKRHG